MRKILGIMLVVGLLFSVAPSAFASGGTTVSITLPTGQYLNPSPYDTDGVFLLQWEQYNPDPTVTFDFVAIIILRASDLSQVYRNGPSPEPQDDPTSNFAGRVIEGLPLNEELVVFINVMDSNKKIVGSGNPKSFILY